MEQNTRRKVSARKLTVLLLLAAKDAKGHDRTPIVGTTRMQKLVFLAKEQSKGQIGESDVFQFDFNFNPDRFGPADLELYQDLELLKAAGWLTVDGETGISQPLPDAVADEAPHGERLLPEDREEGEISFEYLMGEHAEEVDMAEAEREYEKTYAITDAGLALLEKIRKDSGKPDKFDALMNSCAEIKKKYGEIPLSLLLRHVYTQFPATTTKSEIRGRVLR